MFTKGDGFSVHSPLSRSEKDFLLQFMRGSEERVLNDEYLSSDQRAAFNIVKSGHGTRRNPAQQRLRRHWAQQLGVRVHEGAKGGWWNIVGGVSPKGTYGRSPPEGWPQSPPAWDHPSIWVRGQKFLIAVSQPYPWSLNDAIDEINEFAGSYELSFKISNFPSWYYPGCCWFIEWYSKKSPKEGLINPRYGGHGG